MDEKMDEKIDEKIDEKMEEKFESVTQFKSPGNFSFICILRKQKCPKFSIGSIGPTPITREQMKLRCSKWFQSIVRAPKRGCPTHQIQF